MSGIGKISPALFIFVFICFLMPFVNVNCGGQRVISMTGIQMMIGTTFNQGNPFGDTQNQQARNMHGQPFEPLAVIIGVIGLVGLLTSFYRKPRQAITPSLLGAAGAALLFILKVKLDGDVQKSGQGIIQIEYAEGYWLAMVSFAAAAVLNFMVYSSGDEAVVMEDNCSSPPIPNDEPKEKNEAIFCTQCGVKNQAISVFCKSCGNPIE